METKSKLTKADAKGISLRFKARGSGYEIMTRGRGKDDYFGETAKEFMSMWILEQPEFFNRKINEFSSKHTRKGNAVEADSIRFISKMKYNGGLVLPNDEHFADSHKTGTPDIILDDHTADNKASWTAASFPFFDKILDKRYEFQGQVYMDLTGKDKHIVYYTLMDTPHALIMQETYNIAKQLGFAHDDDEVEDIFKETQARLTYGDIPDEMKIRAFEVQRSKEYIEGIHERVEKGREWIYETLLTLCQ